MGERVKVWTTQEIADLLRRSWCAYVGSFNEVPCGHCIPCIAAARLEELAAQPFPAGPPGQKP